MLKMPVEPQLYTLTAAEPTKAKSDWAQPYSIKSNVNAETKSSLIVSLLLQDRAIVVHTLTQKQS